MSKAPNSMSSMRSVVMLSLTILFMRSVHNVLILQPS